MQEILELEEQGWQALSAEGDAGRKFYASILRDDAIMLFPGGMIIAGKENILQSLAAQPWKTFQIKEPQVIQLSRNAKALVYRVSAQREGSQPYHALITSTYVSSKGTWKLVLHQQTQA